jgi:hypothetical protein
MALSFQFNPFTGNFDEISTVSIGSPANGLSITSAQVLSLALSSTSTTGALSNTDWNTFNSKQPAGNYITALTGDATASGPGSAALTLATVNGNVGSFGSAANTLTITANGKGLITAIAATAIQIAESQVTNLVSDLAGKQTTALTSAHILVGNGGVATDTAMSGDITINSTGVTAIGANKVTDAMIRQSSGLSVIGRSASSTGNVADITGTADQVLRVAGAGASVGFGSIDLSKSAAVGSSILPIANGGTGQSSAANAFGALSPLTTKGDILTYSSSNTRLAVGANATVLTADSAVSEGVKWAAIGNIAVATKTADYSITNADGLILVDSTSNTVTLTLPTAVGNAGFVIRIKKINSGTANIITIITTSSQTIDGAVSSRTLSTQNEEWILASDGANWQIQSHWAVLPWTTSTTTIQGSTSNPVKGTTSIDILGWNRTGKFMNIQFTYIQTAAGTAGTGTYIIPIPGGWTAAPLLGSFSTTAPRYIVGQGEGSTASGGLAATSRQMIVSIYDSTHMKISFLTDGSSVYATQGASSGVFDFNSTSLTWTFQARIPIDDWYD